MPSREESAAKKLADIFADERLNVVQLAYYTSFTFTPKMFERLLGWLHWHRDISEKINVRDDGGIEYIQGEYLDYIRKQINRPY